MARGVPEFVEPNLDGSRKRLFRIQDKANIFDIPSELHTKKSESMKFQKVEDIK